MFDKVSLFQDGYIIRQENPNIIRLFENIETTTKQTGDIVICGNIGTMKLIYSSGGLLIRGSLSKYLYGNNIYQLNRDTTGEALEKLSDELHIKINNTRVTGIEFGNTFSMRYTPRTYFSRLGNLARYIRNPFTDDSLYYQTKGKRKNKTLCFYDKAKEMEYKKVDIPKEFENQNLLKYELRLKGNRNISRQMRIEIVTAQTLTDLNFYKRLVEMYISSYKQIRKVSQISIKEMENKKLTIKEAIEMLLAKFLKEKGNNEIADYVNILKMNNNLRNPRYYSRLENKLNNLMAVGEEKDEVLEELTETISNTILNI